MPDFDSTPTERAQLDVNDFKRQAQNIAADLEQLTAAGGPAWSEDRMSQLRAVANSARNLADRIPFYGDDVNLTMPTEGETGVSEEEATSNPEGVDANPTVTSPSGHIADSDSVDEAEVQPAGESEDNSNEPPSQPGVFPQA